jgi:hypothetical protein
MRALALVLFACGSSQAPAPPAPAPTAPTSPAVATPAVPAIAVDAAPPPIATFEGMIAIGAHDDAAIRQLLEARASALATCLASSGPTTTELTLLFADDTPGFKAAWRDRNPLAPPVCLAPIFPLGEVTREERSTVVYVVVKAAPAGTAAPAAPAPPDRRADIEAMFCSLDTLSGADKLRNEPSKARDVMRAWVRTNIRHPAAYELARQIGEQNPAEVKHFVQKSLRAEGITKCPMQRW